MAVAAGYDEQLLIGGEWVESESGARFDVTDPATGDVVGSVPDATDRDVLLAIDAAAAALEGGSRWRRSSVRGFCGVRLT